ncbi:MAG: hypothetical protein Fur0021_40330 [Candidatus Promineifilaceae bacterium]
MKNLRKLLMNLSRLVGPHIEVDWEKGILEEWDELRSFPPIPPADFGYARARLTIYRSDVEWLTVFELVGYESESGECLNEVYAQGNRLASKRNVHFVTFLKPPENSALYPDFDEDEEGNILLNPLDFTVQIYGQQHHFTPPPEDYTNLGIDLDQKTAGEIDAIVKILRYLCYKRPGLMFLDHREILRIFRRPEDLPVFLQTYEWQHPDWRQREKPSDSQCLRSLAVAIAQNDLNLYFCPENFVNTHWSFWPEWPR